MKRILLILFMMIYAIHCNAQSWQWAFTSGLAPRSNAVVIKRDHTENFYFASYTDSVSTSISTQMEKRDANQQSLWQKIITGNATITDLEINTSNHAVVAGYFMGTISIDGNILTSFSPSDNSGFIFETDENGMILWARELNPVNGDFKTNDLFIGSDGNMYLTSEVSGAFGFCAFHKLDVWGFIIKNEFNNNFENRTYSHIIADSTGNVYLTGTCGNFATFDTIAADPNFSYQNFIVKYDSAFNAKWFKAQEYITFDNNNSLSTDGQNLYWAFDGFNSLMDTIKIIKCDYNGQIISTIDGPLALSFFPAIDFEADRFGNSVLLVNVFVRLFIYRFDPAFNIIWQDTIQTYTSGFPLHDGLSVYDSSFYFSSIYMRDTLMVDNFMLLNPNTGANYPSDIFVAKWSNNQLTVAINNQESNNHSLVIYPNPAKGKFAVYISQFMVGDKMKIFDALGNVAYSKDLSTSNVILQTSNFNDGIYFIKVMNSDNEVKCNNKIVVMH